MGANGIPIVSNWQCTLSGSFSVANVLLHGVVGCEVVLVFLFLVLMLVGPVMTVGLLTHILGEFHQLLHNGVQG